MGAAYYLVTDDDSDELATAMDGKALSRASSQLDKIARQLGIEPVSEFVSVSLEEVDAYFGDELDGLDASAEQEGETIWFPPGLGLSWSQTLLDHLAANPDALRDSEAVVADLEALRSAMKKIRARGAQWRLSVAI